MTVYAGADLHGNLFPVPDDCTTLLLGGDICPDFRAPKDQHWGPGVDTSGVRQSDWLDDEFRGWLGGLVHRRGIEVVAIAGNHDFAFEKDGFVPPGLPWTYLEDSGTTIRDGRTVWGTPWVPNLESWAFYGSPATLAVRADAIPRGTDIVMSHGPPLGYGDRMRSGVAIGEPRLAEALCEVRPEVLLCGHIHEARGCYTHEHVRGGVLNVAMVDPLYDPWPGGWVALP